MTVLTFAINSKRNTTISAVMSRHKKAGSFQQDAAELKYRKKNNNKKNGASRWGLLNSKPKGFV
jgi:hypothetical protein